MNLFSSMTRGFTRKSMKMGCEHPYRPRCDGGVTAETSTRGVSGGGVTPGMDFLGEAPLPRCRVLAPLLLQRFVPLNHWNSRLAGPRSCGRHGRERFS
jgi:hypothetical protein